MFKGTVPLNIPPQKSGHNGFIDFWKRVIYTNYLIHLNLFLDILCCYFGPWNFVSMILRAKSALIHIFLGKVCIAP